MSFLISMIDVYVQYDKSKFKQNQEEIHDTNSQLPSDSSKPTATQKKTGYLQEKRDFKEFLSKIPGFEGTHPYLWEEIKDFGYQLLMESTDLKMSTRLLEAFEKFQPVIDELKQE